MGEPGAIAPGIGRFSIFARSNVVSVKLPPAEAPKMPIFSGLRRLQELAIGGDGIIQGCRERKIRRHAVIDRDHLVTGKSRHQDGFPGSGLARIKDPDTAVQVEKHAVPIAGGIDLGVTMKAFTPAIVVGSTLTPNASRSVASRRDTARRLVDNRLPFGGGFWHRLS